MTKGNSAKILFYFAVPMILGNIFQQLYNIIDSIIVGNFVGAEGLAAIGASYPITFICITIANGASIGCGVIISQYFGGKQISKMKSSIYTSIIAISITGFILTICGLIFIKNILSFMNVPFNVINDAQNYLAIYLIGVIFLFIYNISNSAFNAMGNSRTPLAFLIASSVLNVILDLIFVTKFNMGVKGAAYATLISMFISAALSCLYLLRKIKNISETHNSRLFIGVSDSHKIQDFSPLLKENSIESVKFFDIKILKDMSKIALPSILQQSIVSIGNLLVQSLINSFGSIVIAGYTAAARIDSITILPMVTMSNSISTFTAQNIGAKKPERIKSGYKAAIIMTGIFCVFIFCILFIFGHNIIGMFIDKGSNMEVINVGVNYMRIVSLFYFLMGLMVITNGVLRAAGDIKFFLGSSCINLGIRVCMSYIMAQFIGVIGIWYAVPLGWIFASIFSILRYLSGKWKDKKIIEI